MFLPPIFGPRPHCGTFILTIKCHSETIGLWALLG
jgi:hypothetical protein